MHVWRFTGFKKKKKIHLLVDCDKTNKSFVPDPSHQVLSWSSDGLFDRIGICTSLQFCVSSSLCTFRGNDCFFQVCVTLCYYDFLRQLKKNCFHFRVSIISSNGISSAPCSL